MHLFDYGREIFILQKDTQLCSNENLDLRALLVMM